MGVRNWTQRAYALQPRHSNILTLKVQDRAAPTALSGPLGMHRNADIIIPTAEADSAGPIYKAARPTEKSEAERSERQGQKRGKRRGQGTAAEGSKAGANVYRGEWQHEREQSVE